VADALLSLSDKYREEGEERFTMSISRNDLASLVGTATESLIRSLSDLKDEGLISIKGSQVSIENHKGLSRIRQRVG
jgi:CRP-like cAMP-binding protein